MNFETSSIIESEVVDASLHVIATIAIVAIASFIVVFVVDLLLFVCCKKDGIFFKHKPNQIVNNSQDIENNHGANVQYEQKIEYVCEYCGAIMDCDEKYCSACGAKRHAKKQTKG